MMDRTDWSPLGTNNKSMEDYEHECVGDKFGYCNICQEKMVDEPVTKDELDMDLGERQSEESKDCE